MSIQTPTQAQKTWLSISTTKTLMDIMSDLHALQLGQVHGHKLMVRLVLDFQSSTDVLIPHADCVWKIITLLHVSSFQSCPEFWDWRKQTEKREGGLGDAAAALKMQRCWVEIGHPQWKKYEWRIIKDGILGLQLWSVCSNRNKIKLKLKETAAH